MTIVLQPLLPEKRRVNVGQRVEMEVDVKVEVKVKEEEEEEVEAEEEVQVAEEEEEGQERECLDRLACNDSSFSKPCKKHALFAEA